MTWSYWLEILETAISNYIEDADCTRLFQQMKLSCEYIKPFASEAQELNSDKNISEWLPSIKSVKPEKRPLKQMENSSTSIKV